MKKIIKFYKNLTFAQGAVFTVTLSSVIAIAAPITGIHVFSPGQTISSADVNDNFNILKTTVEGLSSGQTYVGTYDASTAVPPAAGSAAGEYYIITTAGTFNAEAYAINDWTMWDGSTWERVPNGAPVTSVFARTGAIVATEGDYNLTKLSDVTITSPSTNQVLKFNGSQWVNSVVTESDPSVQPFAQSPLPTCAVGEVLKSNGTAFTCVTDDAGTPFSGTANVVVTTNGSGLLTSSATTATELGHLTGATSNLQTQINSKASAASFVDWMSTGVQTIHPSRLNLTTGNKVLVTDATGFLVTSSVNSSELNYLTGVTSAIQSQINGKVSNLAGTFSTSANAPFFQVASNGAANSTAFRGTTAGTGLFFPSSTSLALSTAGTESLSISNTGNVGIGNIAPAVKLDIGTTGDSNNVVQVNSGATGLSEFVANTNAGASIHMTSNFSGSGFQGIPSGAAGIIVGNPVPFILSVNAQEKMRVEDNSSNATISIPSAGSSTTMNSILKFQRLHGTMAAPTAVQANDYLGTINFTGHNSISYTPGAVISAVSPEAYTSSSSPANLIFKTTPSGSTIANERMRITLDGRIGIGTAAPSSAMEIVGIGSNSALILPRDNTAGRPASPMAGMIRYNTTSNDLEYYNGSAWSTIGVASDARLKTNVVDVDNGLSLVKKLRPVYFDWNQNVERAKTYGNQHQVGFLAQEVEKVLPEVVTKAKDTFRTMEYGKIVAVVVSAVQELSSKFDSLQARVSSRDREMEFVKEENKMMKQYLCTRDPMAPFCEQ